MRASFLLVLLMMIILLISGCNGQTNEELLHKTEEKLVGINTYQFTALIEVFGNKNSQLYEIIHYYKEGKYRLESISPEHLKGKIVIIDGNRAKIYHPNIDQSIIIDNIQRNAYESIFLGDFKNWDFHDEIELLDVEEGNQGYLIITKTNHEEDYYHHKESLWINRKTRLPEYIKIVDRDSNIRVNIIIKDLILNKEIGDELFTM